MAYCRFVYANRLNKTRLNNTKSGLIQEVVAFITILLGLGLLGLTVYMLHRHQSQAVEFSVERTLPLPPLSADLGNNIEVRWTKRLSADTDPVQLEPEPSQHIKTIPWQRAASQLRKSGDIAAALEICKKELPQWTAFNKCCTLLRSQLKNTDLSSTQAEEILARMYKLAATAELLHAKSPEFTRLSRKQLKALPAAQISKMEMPYREIGYSHLRLIRKSDIKLMLSSWGNPLQHQPPRRFHLVSWELLNS